MDGSIYVRWQREGLCEEVTLQLGPGKHGEVGQVSPVSSSEEQAGWVLGGTKGQGERGRGRVSRKDRKGSSQGLEGQEHRLWPQCSLSWEGLSLLFQKGPLHWHHEILVAINRSTVLMLTQCGGIPRAIC